MSCPRINDFPPKLSNEEEQEVAKQLNSSLPESTRTELLNKLALSGMREALAYAGRVCKHRFNEGELISICFGTLMRHARRFKPGWQRFFAFAKAGIRGDLSRHWKTLDTVRNASQHEEFVEPGDDDFVREEETVQPNFHALFVKEQWTAVQKIIAQHCNEREKTVLQLTYEGQMNYEEIGQLLGVSRSAVQATHAKAIRKIRNTISNHKRLFSSEDFGD